MRSVLLKVVIMTVLITALGGTGNNPLAGLPINNTVDLTPYFDWGAISTYGGLGPPGNMGIWAPAHSRNFYFPSDSETTPVPSYPKAWLIPGVHLATDYGPANVRLASNPIFLVPDRNSSLCTLFVEVPLNINEATDSNVIQISSGESKTIGIYEPVETMVFLANCDGYVQTPDWPSPSQPLQARLYYHDGAVCNAFFDIHPAGRLDIINPSWIFIYGNEIFVCDPAYFDLPSPYYDPYHSETWHWYGLYPDNTKYLDSMTFIGIQPAGPTTDIHILAISVSSAVPPEWGDAIDGTVDLSPFYDWGAISSYAGLAPPGFMGIYSPTHFTSFYFPSDSSSPAPPNTPKAWLIPDVHLATGYGPANAFIPGNPMITVPDRNSRPCSLFVEVPPGALIDEAGDQNVLQISSGESVLVPVGDTAETVVFLANCDGWVYAPGVPSPDQPLWVLLDYNGGTQDTFIFDNIHPSERADNVAYPGNFIFCNEVFGCGPAYYDLPSPAHDNAHSEFWHWYALYPDTTKLLDAVIFEGIQSGDTSEIYILAISYSALPCCNHDGIRGDVNMDNMGPNVSDLTRLVSYIKNIEPTLPCFEEADVNVTGTVNVSDVTYLAAYIKGTGPAPLACP
jgi:hypothetical protein